MRRVLKADSQIFNLSGVDIIGNSNVINGNDNNVYGNSNAISGCRNTIYGNSNAVRGSFNCVKGDSNMIVGSYNKYSGSGNSCSSLGWGNEEVVSGETFPGDVITWVPPYPRASADRTRETVESTPQTTILSTTEGTSNRYPGESETRMDEQVEGEDNLGTACVVCWERKRRCMAQPCNHLNMCATCTREICQLAEKDNKKPLCPTCKTPIDQSVIVFIP